MGKITRTELTNALAERLGYIKTEARRLVDALFEVLRDAIMEGNRIEIRGFGVFEVRTMAQRWARNPRTGERVRVPARRKVRFRAGKAVREVLKRPVPMARVLVMDDEATVRSVIRAMLERAGYEVEEAVDGADGMERYRQNPADVVIVDIFMPEKSGLEVIQELAREYPDARIISITSVGIREGLDMHTLAVQYGAHRAMEKPFTREELMGAVQEVLAQQ